MENNYLIVDSVNNLWICNNITNNENEWSEIFQEEIRKYHPDKSAWSYSIEVSEFLKISNDKYKIEALISGTCNPVDVKYSLLLNNNGCILDIKHMTN